MCGEVCHGVDSILARLFRMLLEVAGALRVPATTAAEYLAEAEVNRRVPRESATVWRLMTASIQEEVAGVGATNGSETPVITSHASTGASSASLRPAPATRQQPILKNSPALLSRPGGLESRPPPGMMN